MYTLSLKLESENATVKVTDALNRKSTSINRQDMISVSLPRMSKPGLMNAIPKLGGASIPPEETLNKKKDLHLEPEATHKTTKHVGKRATSSRVATIGL